MKVEWTKGEDYYETHDSYKTYGINRDDHTNAVEIHRREEDRDLILQLLQYYEEALNGIKP
jgi:hypothetical protein